MAAACRYTTIGTSDCTFPRQYGVRAVRRCMVLEVRDEAGTILFDRSASGEGGGGTVPKGKLRFLRVALDQAQYALDALGGGSPLGTGVYETLNLVIRRSGCENNFRLVLETIRLLMRGGRELDFPIHPKLAGKLRSLCVYPQRSVFGVSSVWFVSPPTKLLT